MEPIKLLGKISLPTCLQKPYQVSKEGRFLADVGTSGYSVDLGKKGIHPNLSVLQGKSDGKLIAWLPTLRETSKSPICDSLCDGPAEYT